MKEEYLKTIESFQHCQRNWDLSREIDDSDIDFLIEAGYNIPTKQNLNSFTIVCIKDRDEINKWSRIATNADFTKDCLPDGVLSELENGGCQNPQVQANILFLFFTNEQERSGKLRIERERGPNPTYHEWLVTRNIEIGMASASIGIAANMMGLKTGFCGCINVNGIPDEWTEQWNHEGKTLQLMMGVGYPLHEDHTLTNDKRIRKESFSKAPYNKIIV